MLVKCKPFVVWLATVVAVCLAVGPVAEAQPGPPRGSEPELAPERPPMPPREFNHFAPEAQIEHPRGPEHEFAPGRPGGRFRRGEHEFAPGGPPGAPAEFGRFRRFAERHRGRDMSEEDLAEMVELVRAWRMTKEVGLTEEQSLKFLNLGREKKEESGKLAEQRRQAQSELRRLVDDSASEDGAIAKQLEVLEGIEEKQIALRQQYEKRMAEGLTVRQRAKMKLFKSRFHRDMRRLIEHVREDQGRDPRHRPWRRRQAPGAPRRQRAPMPRHPGPRRGPID